MPTELLELDLMEVSLVDAGDDPLAKVALYKRKEGSNMDEEQVDETITEDDKGKTRKSWKTEAETLAQEVETLKARIEELEKPPVEKAAEEMIELYGEMVAKSAVPAPVLKKLEELEKAREVEQLQKRAQEVLPNFKGTLDQRAKLLKSIGDDAELIEMLRAADALFAGLFTEVGKTDPENDMKTPSEKLVDMANAYMTEKGEKDFYKAYAAVSATPEGKALLLKYKK